MNRTSRTPGRTLRIAVEIPTPPHLNQLVSLEEIDHWLSKYRELVKSVEGSAHEQISAVMSRLEAHHRQRRAELS